MKSVQVSGIDMTASSCSPVSLCGSPSIYGLNFGCCGRHTNLFTAAPIPALIFFYCLDSILTTFYNRGSKVVLGKGSETSDPKLPELPFVLPTRSIIKIVCHTKEGDPGFCLTHFSQNGCCVFESLF